MPTSARKPSKPKKGHQKRSEAAKKAWETMRREGTTPKRLSEADPINLRPGTDGQLMVTRLLKKGVCACILAEVTGRRAREVIRAASGK